MKKYRVIFLVVFMLSVSVLGFVSQGEELTTVSEIEHNDFEADQTEIETEMKVMESLPVATQTLENVDLLHNIEQPKMDEEKLAGVYEANSKTEEQVEAELVEEVELPEQYDRIQKIVELTPLDERTAGIVIKYSDLYQIRPSLILGVMDLESNFSQYLVGTSDDRGYMQIIPGTEKWLVSSYGDELGITYDPSQIFEPDYNIPLAVKYLSVLSKEFKGDETKMLTAYNRGSGGLRKWFNEHGTYETAYSRVVLKRAKKYIDVK